MSRNGRVALVSSIFAAVGCVPPASAPVVTESPTANTATGASSEVRFEPTWPMRARARTVIGERGIVASNSTLASAVGVGILKRGGNAVDAAVAVGFALAVTHPEAGNLGGGGFMLVRLSSGRGVLPARGPVTAALDFRETAPAAATRDMYAATAADATLGYRAIAVPGTVAGLVAALERYGTLPLATVTAPAVRLAEEGFAVDSLLARSLAQSRTKIMRFAGRDTFFPNGRPLRAGDLLRQPALGRTLRRIARGGADAFYRGAIAAELAADIRAGGGPITEHDIRGYQATWRAPVSVRYRGYTLLGPPLPSSGALTAGEALLILEASGRAPPFGGARAVHLLASSLQRAFADRAALGDPAHTPGPMIARMLDRRRAAAQASTIDPERARPTGSLPRVARREGPETTHWSVVDQHGNAVSATTTINDLFGSGAYVRSLGFFLNDTMDDFAAPATTAAALTAGGANEIGAGKRPLSSMTPMMLLDPERRLVLVAGSRGGPRIISNVVQLVVNVVDHSMTLADAISAPRVHHQAIPDELRYELGGFRSVVVDSLRSFGYALSGFRPDTLPYVGRMVGVGRARFGWAGVVDPRFGALAVGY